MIESIDTYSGMVELLNSPKFSLSAWERYARSLSDELPAKCMKDAASYDFERQVLPVIERVKGNPALDQLHDAVQQISREISPLFAQRGLREPKARLILYLGLCNGAGWATQLEGRDVVLLGAEKILELGWQDKRKLSSLIHHELGRLWHKQYGRFENPKTQEERSVLQLFQEDAAMYIEQLLGGDARYYIQDKNGWLEWCEQHQADMKKEYLSRLYSGESTQDFFGDWRRFQGYSDVGYYLGTIFFRFLLFTYSLPEAAGLDYPHVRQEFLRFAENAEAV